MQGAVLPLHRSGSGQKRGAAARRLSSTQLQGVAFLAFLGLLCLYVGYYVRTLAASAARQRAPDDPLASLAALSAAAGQLPEPLNGPADGAAALEPRGGGLSGLADARLAPAAAAFSSFRRSARREGQFNNNGGGGGGGVRPHPHQSAPQQQPLRQAPVQVSAPGVGQHVAQHMANREHAPIQVVAHHAAAAAQHPAAGRPPQKLETAMEKTTWLAAELQAHYKRACVDSHVAPGSVPAKACSRLMEIGQSLGDEQRAGSGARFVAAMQTRAFPLIEIVRQSIGAARPGSDVVLGAATVMKELSTLGRMDVSGTGEAGVRRASMFGDDFLDAHVGSHFDEPSSDTSGPQGGGGGGGGLAALQRQPQPQAHPAPQEPRTQQPPGAQRRQEQRDALRAHQHISIGQVGFNQALVAGSAPLIAHRAGARHAADGAQAHLQYAAAEELEPEQERRRSR